ncbi:hypothetical protein HDU88_008749, partial [Geranomyces variabilis]
FVEIVGSSADTVEENVPLVAEMLPSVEEPETVNAESVPRLVIKPVLIDTALADIPVSVKPLETDMVFCFEDWSEVIKLSALDTRVVNAVRFVLVTPKLATVEYKPSPYALLIKCSGRLGAVTADTFDPKLPVVEFTPLSKVSGDSMKTPGIGE